MKYTKLFVMERRVKYDMRYFVLYTMDWFADESCTKS